MRGQAISEGGGAFSVWQSILRALCLRGELDELEASVLKVIVPDLERLLERPIADAPELHAQAAQLRLMSVIESLLLRQRDPLLLLLKTCTGPMPSLSLLRRVALARQSRPLLILASYRDDESPSLPGVSRLAGDEAGATQDRRHRRAVAPWLARRPQRRSS